MARPLDEKVKQNEKFEGHSDGCGFRGAAITWKNKHTQGVKKCYHLCLITPLVVNFNEQILETFGACLILEEHGEH